MAETRGVEQGEKERERGTLGEEEQERAPLDDFIHY